MLRSLSRLLTIPARQVRLYSQLTSTASPAAVHSTPSDTLSVQRATSSAIQLPYFVRRNSKGSIPVFTRNDRTRHLVIIRNVEGDADALAGDLCRTLFPAGSNEAESIKIHTVRHKHVVLGGGRWRNDIIRWLVQNGF